MWYRSAIHPCHFGSWYLDPAQSPYISSWPVQSWWCLSHYLCHHSHVQRSTRDECIGLSLLPCRMACQVVEQALSGDRHSGRLGHGRKRRRAGRLDRCQSRVGNHDIRGTWLVIARSRSSSSGLEALSHSAKSTFSNSLTMTGFTSKESYWLRVPFNFKGSLDSVCWDGFVWSWAASFTEWPLVIDLIPLDAFWGTWSSSTCGAMVKGIKHKN